MSDKKYEEWLELMKDTPKEELLKYHYNLLFKFDKKKEELDKIKEYARELRLFDNESVEFEISNKILELLEEIE